MRARAETFARRWWAGELGVPGAVLSALAVPVSAVWSVAARVRARAYAGSAGRRIEGLVVVSVGNLAVGGTGKTPVAAWIARTIRDFAVPTWVVAGAQGEDEAHLHRVWNLDVPVVVDRDRVAGARRARAEGARVAVLDDGFQHRRLARDLDVVLLSAEDPFPGPVLPRGPYREGPYALERAGVVLVTRRVASPDRGAALAARAAADYGAAVKGCVHVAPGRWTTLDGGPAPSPRGDVLAVCGVARSGVFRSTVEELVEGRTELAAFPDHYDYRRAEVAAIRRRAGERPVATTEKDAVKLRPHRDVIGEAYVLTEELRWDWGEREVVGLLREVTDEVVAR